MGIEVIKKKIGGSDRDYKLCYSSKVHGFSTSTFHSRCDGKHDFLMVQQRNDNGRVFGGWVGLKKFDIGTYTRSSGYLHGNVRGRAWMYRLNPSNKQIEFAEKATATNTCTSGPTTTSRGAAGTTTCAATMDTHTPTWTTTTTPRTATARAPRGRGCT